MKQKKKNQQLKNIIIQIKSAAANTVFINIIILKNFIVFLFRQNIHFYFTFIFFNSLKPQKRKHKREKSDCV